MKRYIRSNSASSLTQWETKKSSDGRWSDYASFRYTWKFGVHYNVKYIKVLDSYALGTGYMRSYHPYDDAEYTWAEIDGAQVRFIKDGKVLDKMSIADYDESMFGDDFEEYLKDTFQSIADVLLEYDKGKVEPRMMHN